MKVFVCLAAMILICLGCAPRQPGEHRELRKVVSEVCRIQCPGLHGLAVEKCVQKAEDPEELKLCVQACDSGLVVCYALCEQIKDVPEEPLDADDVSP